MFIGLGRRKEARAKIKLISGSGTIIINQQILDLVSPNNLVYRTIINQPLKTLGLENSYDIIANVTGGGKKSQVEAIQLGVARAVSQINFRYRAPLKIQGYLTRDARSKERRKYGLKKARKAPQFSKR